MLSGLPNLRVRRWLVGWLIKLRAFQRLQSAEVSLIEDDDLTSLLKQIGRWDELIDGRMRCAHCDKVLTLDNLSGFIVQEHQYQFFCDSQVCLSSTAQS